MRSVTYTPKCFATVCDEKPKEYSDYEHFKISWGNSEYYEVIKKVGRGRYSEVFDSVNIANNQRCIIKILKPIRKEKIRREVKILQILCGGPNIIILYDVIKDIATNTPCLVFEATDNVDFRDIYPTLTDFDVPYYIYGILRALDYSHSKGIMHRDIKPQNLIVNPVTKSIKVADWGLAEFYHHGTEYNVRVASRYYKGPELLTDDTLYDYSLDIWSLGCTLAEIIFKKVPFFKGKDNYDQLVKIAKVLGTQNLTNYIDKYKLKIDPQYNKILGNYQSIPLTDFVTAENSKVATPDAIDLLGKMLVYDKAERPTAREAMNHPYFTPVKEYLAKVNNN